MTMNAYAIMVQEDIQFPIAGSIIKPAHAGHGSPLASRVL